MVSWEKAFDKAEQRIKECLEEAERGAKKHENRWHERDTGEALGYKTALECLKREREELTKLPEWFTMCPECEQELKRLITTVLQWKQNGGAATAFTAGPLRDLAWMTEQVKYDG